MTDETLQLRRIGMSDFAVVVVVLSLLSTAYATDFPAQNDSQQIRIEKTLRTICCLFVKLCKGEKKYNPYWVHHDRDRSDLPRRCDQPSH